MPDGSSSDAPVINPGPKDFKNFLSFAMYSFELTARQPEVQILAKNGIVNAMTLSDIAWQRLYNQRLIGPKFASAAEAVAWLGAVQAQDYVGAKWAVAQRTKNTDVSTIDAALAEGKILRTHVMRPTWHFVAPQDIRWMLQISVPQLERIYLYYAKQIGLDDALFAKSSQVLQEALHGKKQLTRHELRSALQDAGLGVEGLRFMHILARAELNGLLCNGGLRGKQQTYALLDEWVPAAKTLSRDEALAELAKRYFTSHGPAQLKDYMWWSGLRAVDAKRGIELAVLQQEIVEGATYYFAELRKLPKVNSPLVHLLPNYDEYTVAYRDRSAIVGVDPNAFADINMNFFTHALVIDSKIAGMWRRDTANNTLKVTITPLRKLTSDEKDAISNAVKTYGEFMQMPVSVIYT